MLLRFTGLALQAASLRVAPALYFDLGQRQ